MSSCYFCTRIVALGTTIAQRACTAVRTDFHTTNLVHVNWTGTMINQRRLPPVLLMTPILLRQCTIMDVNQHGGWTQVSNNISDLQGATYDVLLVFNCNCVYLAQFPRYYQLFPKT